MFHTCHFWYHRWWFIIGFRALNRNRLPQNRRCGSTKLPFSAGSSQSRWAWKKDNWNHTTFYISSCFIQQPPRISQSANLRYPANKNGWVSAVLWRKNQLQLLYRYGKLPTSPDFQIPNETNWVSRLRDIQPEGLGRRTVPCTVRLCKILVVVLTEIWGTPHAPNISSPQKLRDVLALLIFQGPLRVLVKSPQLG